MLLRTMATAKRYNHPYIDGQLVHDVQFNETYLFRDKKDGFRAQHYPDKIRLATAEEAAAFDRAQAAAQQTGSTPRP